MSPEVAVTFSNYQLRPGLGSVS